MVDCEDEWKIKKRPEKPTSAQFVIPDGASPERSRRDWESPCRFEMRGLSSP